MPERTIGDYLVLALIVVVIALAILIIIAAVRKLKKQNQTAQCSVCQVVQPAEAVRTLRPGETICSICASWLNDISVEKYSVNALRNEMLDRKAEAAEEEAQRLRDNPLPAQAQQEEAIRCPKCGSSQLTAGGKRLSVGRAVVGGVLLGGVGAVAGGLSSKKTIITCLKCGNRWQAGR